MKVVEYPWPNKRLNDVLLVVTMPDSALIHGKPIFELDHLGK